MARYPYVATTSQFIEDPDAAGPLIMLTKNDVTYLRVRRDAKPMQAKFRELLDLLLPPRFRSAHQAHRAQQFDRPRDRSMGTAPDFFGLRKDSSEFPVEISLSALETKDGTLISNGSIALVYREGTRGTAFHVGWPRFQWDTKADA
jgi:hypothetical protein